MIEAAIAPRSHFAGQTLQEIRFEQKFNAKVLAVWRCGRSIRARLSNLPLEFGDGLLLQGAEKSFKLLSTEPGLIVLGESTPSIQITPRGWLTALIMALTLTLAVIFPNLIAEMMLSGAVAMVILGTLNMDQAYRAVDRRSLFLVAGMLPVGVALNKTGASELFALTQIINGAAAVTVLAPIAIATAQQVGMDLRSVALAVAIASSMAFMSPLGHSMSWSWVLADTLSAIMPAWRFRLQYCL